MLSTEPILLKQKVPSMSDYLKGISKELFKIEIV
jgi:hypothetical protein